MTKYKQEVKDAAVNAAKEGMHLKTVQQTIGPNPAATKRYMIKAAGKIERTAASANIILAPT